MNVLRDKWFNSFLICVLAFACTARADDSIPLADAKGKTGAFAAKMSERSPLSAPAEVSRRVSLKPEQQGRDYDIAKELFDLYVPTEPGDGGKYGVMVALSDLGPPPAAWPAVLEAKHLIWVGPQNNGQSQPVSRQIGVILDAVHNVKKVYPVDDRRVYLFAAFPKSPTAEIALYYPEVFGGSLHVLKWDWFGEITWGRTKHKMGLEKPDEKSLDMARKNGRFFLAQRQSEDKPGGISTGQLVLDYGFKKAGFEHAKLISVPDEQIGAYGAFPASWFEQGLEFLDAPLGAKSNVVAAPPAAASDAKPTAQGGISATKPSGVGAPAPDAAARALALAKSYISAQRYDAARQRLQTIIKTYPDSPAAKEAQTLLQQIQGK